MTDGAEAPTKAPTLRTLFGRDSLYVALWGIQIVLTAVLTPVTARLLAPAQFGTVAVCTAIMEVLYVLTGFGLAAGAQRAYVRYGSEHARTIVGCSGLLASGICAVVFALGPLWAPALGFSGFPGAVQWAVIWAALNAFTSVGLGFIKSRDDLRAFAAVTLTQSVIAEIVAVGMIVVIARSPTIYMLGQALVQAFTVALMIALVRPRLPKISDVPLMRMAMSYSLPLVPSGLAAFIFDSSDRLVVRADLGPVEAARYSVARNIGGLTIILLTTLNSVWMPRLFAVEDDSSKRRALLAASRDGLLRLVPAAVFAISSASPVILWLWVPGSYHPDGLLLVTALVAIAAVPVATSQAAVRVVLLSGSRRQIAVCTVTGAAVNLALNLVLVPLLGIDGSALATVCAYSVQFALLHRIARRVDEVPPVPLWLAAGVLAGSLMAVAVAKVPTSAPLLTLRILAAVAAGSFLLVQIVRLAELKIPRFNGIVSKSLGRIARPRVHGTDRTSG